MEYIYTRGIFPSLLHLYRIRCLAFNTAISLLLWWNFSTIPIVQCYAVPSILPPCPNLELYVNTRIGLLEKNAYGV